MSASSSHRGLSIVVPMYDEAEGVAALVARLREFVATESARRPVELILVDDGSRDGTWDALLAAIPAGDARWHCLRHAANQGLTAALRTGSDAATMPLVAWLDADLSYEVATLGRLAEALDGGAAFATASCHARGGRIDGVSWFRAWLSRQASRLYRIATGHRVATFTCMVRAQEREVLLTTWPERTGFLGVTEQMLRVLERGARVAEVPATLRARRTGRSKLRVLRAIRAHLGLVAAARRGLSRRA